MKVEFCIFSDYVEPWENIFPVGVIDCPPGGEVRLRLLPEFESGELADTEKAQVSGLFKDLPQDWRRFLEAEGILTGDRRVLYCMNRLGRGQAEMLSWPYVGEADSDDPQSLLEAAEKYHSDPDNATVAPAPRPENAELAHLLFWRVMNGWALKPDEWPDEWFEGVKLLTKDELEEKREQRWRQSTVSKVIASRANYIKLGRKGAWEGELKNGKAGTIRLSYKEILKDSPPHPSTDEEWNAIRRSCYERHDNQRVANSHFEQIRTFFESTEDTIFITFSAGCLYWCRPTGPAQMSHDGSGTRFRNTLTGWNNTSTGGKPLTRDSLSGRLWKTGGFRGTICNVEAFEYLLGKINDVKSASEVKAERAQGLILESIESLMRDLEPKDFELLVDLVFAESGWRRTSQVGGAQKTTDFEIELTTPPQRAFVQVKSKASKATLAEYSDRFDNERQHADFKYMFFVWHTGSIPDIGVEGVTMIGPPELAKRVLDSGLWSWLRKKAG